MKVIATKMGYYNHVRVKDGQEFNLNDKSEFSKAWMQASNEKAEPKAKASVKAEPKAEKVSYSESVI